MRQQLDFQRAVQPDSGTLRIFAGSSDDGGIGAGVIVAIVAGVLVLVVMRQGFLLRSSLSVTNSLQ